MIQYNLLKIKFKLGFIILLNLFPSISKSQAPSPALIGYFHNWQDLNAPYLQLDQVDSRYNMINIAFAVPQIGTDYNMKFTPDQVKPSVFISQIRTLQSQGKKILISIGGATAPISLDNIMERDTFIVSMTNIINTYGFDGIDIDFEGSSLSIANGTISSPIEKPIINLINAIQQIMANYYTTYNRRLLLTMAPETAFVQGGQSAYSGIWGAYLPVIDALRDSLEVMHVQLYNSGSMYGIDGNIYTQGTADFIVSMTEALIQGFNTKGGMFKGLPPDKVAIGLPACSKAAGGGFTSKYNVESAINYLKGQGPKAGSYILAHTDGYPMLRGMMTWSINWDASITCGSTHEFADNYEKLFKTTTTLTNTKLSRNTLHPYPNPANDFLTLNISEQANLSEEYKIYNLFGEIVLEGGFKNSGDEINISKLKSGIYYISISNYKLQFVKI